MTATTDIRLILNEYLSHIIYLDDQFKVFWRRQVKGLEEIKKPMRRTISKDQQENNVGSNPTKKQFDGKSLYNFCLAAQKDFSDLTITPLIYENRFDEDKEELLEIIKKLQSAKLVVIDGFLSKRMHAADIIAQMKNSQELKLIVIYTAQRTETLDRFENEGYELREGKFVSENGKDKTYSYAITQDFALMICEKDHFDFRDIINSYVDLFLNHYGRFPVAFIDVVSKIEKNNSKYLSTFSKPFDSLMLLQSSSEGLPQEDMHTTLNSIIVNQIKQDMHVNSSIIKNIYDEEFNMLERRIKADDFKIILFECLKEMISKIKKCKNKTIIIETLESIDVEEYKQLLLILVKERENFGSKTRNVCTQFKSIYADTYLNNLFQKDKGLNLPSVIQNDIKKARKNDLADIESLIPLFISTLANKVKDSEYLLQLSNMVSLMKTYKYPGKQTKLEDIFSDCYEVDTLRDDAPTINKLFAGDIYYDATSSEDIYLCITPSCHLFRPNKVNNTVLFIKGAVNKKYPSGKQKDSEHLTFLPDPNEENDVCIVKWDFHNIKQLDLKQKDESVFNNWFRPYRLLDEYHKQIMSEFNSFYSKVGVEELFVKSNKTLTDILLES